MKHSISHDLGKEKAKQAALAAFESYQARFGKYRPNADWVTPDRANISFSVKGMTLNGSIEVGERSIDMDLDVPFMLRPFKGQALGVIEGEIKKWIEKARSGAV